MKREYLFVFAILAIIGTAVVVSGCLEPLVPTSARDGDNQAAQVSLSGDTITITGTKTDREHDQYSDTFELKQGQYLLTWENSDRSDDAFSAMLIGERGTKTVGCEVLRGSPKTEKVLGIGNNIMAREGTYHLEVLKGDKYKVTVTRVTSGVKLPLSVDVPAQGTAIKAIELGQGKLIITAKNPADMRSSRYVELTDPTGNASYSKFENIPGKGTVVNETPVSAGLHVIRIYSLEGCNVTLSQ